MKHTAGVLGWVLRLYPCAFRDRFGGDLRVTYDAWRENDRAAARRMLWDLACNAPGCHLDELRLASRRPRPLTRPKETLMLDPLLRDLSYSLRRLRRSWVVSLLAAATLALGIGGTTAIFSMIQGVILRPLSAPDAGRLVLVSEQDSRGRTIGMSYENFRDYRAATHTLSDLAVVRSQSVAVTGGGENPERIRGLFVSASFFTVLGEPPLLGRAIAEGEDVPGGERTAVLSHGFWQRRFGGDPRVIGRHLQLNNEDHVIVGVMGPDFRLPLDTTEAWISLQTLPGTFDRASRSFMFAIGRLAESATLAQATEELGVIARQLAQEYPDVNSDGSAFLTPLVEWMSRGRTRDLFLVLVAAVAMVLLIGAANVANLQLSQAAGRVREMAIRTAVGAAGNQLRMQVLSESLLLAALGGVLGLGVAYGGIRLMTSWGPEWLLGAYKVDPDLTVLGFAAAVSMLTGLAFGLAPARRAARFDLVHGLQEGAPRQGQSRTAGRLRATLVIAQTALAVMLVIGAGLLLRSLDNLSRVDVGFAKEQLLQVQFRLPSNKYVSDEQVVSFFDRLIERVAAVPGVRGVATAFGMPFTGDEGEVAVLADGIDRGASEADLPQISYNVVSRDYFQVLGIPLLAGRGFGNGDRAGGTPVTIISAAAGRQLWPDAAAGEIVGRTFSVSGDDSGTIFQIVGVVGDVYNRGLRAGVDPMLYVDLRQQPQRFATLAARVDGDPHALAGTICKAIWELDPDQPLWEVMTQEERIDAWSGGDRFITFLLAIFALVALMLAAIGLGGVIGYSVTLRRHELGVRMSLGATRGQILRLVMAEGMGLVAVGLGIGLVGAVALHDALTSFLFGIDRLEPAVFATTPLILALVALVSILGPACRAAWLDPVRTLREE